jgi:hypothetical protein
LLVLVGFPHVEQERTLADHALGAGRVDFTDLRPRLFQQITV